MNNEDHPRQTRMISARIHEAMPILKFTPLRRYGTRNASGGFMRKDMSRTLRFFAAAALTLSLTSCVTGPNFHRPDIQTPNGYKSAAAQEQVQPNLSRDWWLLFNDQELSSLVQEALNGNLGLKAAMARVTQSRAAARSIKSEFFPVVSLDPSVTRTWTPGVKSQSSDTSDASDVINGVSGVLGQVNKLVSGGSSTQSSTSSTQTTASTSASASVSTATTSIRAPFDLSYEIDAWGRIARTYEAANAETRSSEFDFEVVRQTLLADLAKNYFNLRSLDDQYEILERNLDLYQKQVDLTQNQYKAGLSNETSVLQAVVQLESTRAQATDTLRERTDLEHAIAILLGRAPSDFSLEARPLSSIPPVIPAGMPSDLLRRRPDVAEAEQNLAASCAEIGVAKANFYPTIQLTGSAGFENSDVKGLADWKSSLFSFGPSVSLPIFQGGKLKANLEKAKARYDELESTYRANVLTAFNDVEDCLTDLHMRADALDAQSKAVVAAREYLRLTQIEYQSGIVDYMNVVNAEQTLVSNELSEAQTKNLRMASTVLLIKALGGGWDSESPAPIPVTPPQGPAEPEKK
jgi:multidrug efflux system outer membrane protein